MSRSPDHHLLQQCWVNLTTTERPQALAREQIRQALTDRTTPERLDDALTVVSELVANAVQHASTGPVCMSLDVYRDSAVIWVHDGDRDAAAVRVRNNAPARELAESGRGLCLVDLLASRWFVWPTATGKAVAAVIELNAAEGSAARPTRNACRDGAVRPAGRG